MHHGVHDLEVSAALLHSCKQLLYRICSKLHSVRYQAVSLRASFNDLQRLEALREEETRAALVEALVQPENDELLKVNFLGRAELSTNKNDTVPCLVLSPTSPPEDESTYCFGRIPRHAHYSSTTQANILCLPSKTTFEIRLPNTQSTLGESRR